MPTLRRPGALSRSLPRLYAITGQAADSDEWRRRFDRLLTAGLRMIQLRLPGVDAPSFEAAARWAAARCRAADVALMLNGPVELVMTLEGVGLHLPSAALLRQHARPVPGERLLGASCHDRQELEHAAAIGVDFACLSPVFPTASHPGATALGPEGFAAVIAGIRLPVYALGGAGPDRLAEMRAAGAYGIAGISAFWG
jgi:thiamine-phosphate diphosphorylase